jgi:hypothetical protein
MVEMVEMVGHIPQVVRYLFCPTSDRVVSCAFQEPCGAAALMNFIPLATVGYS